MTEFETFLFRVTKDEKETILEVAPTTDGFEEQYVAGNELERYYSYEGFFEALTIQWALMSRFDNVELIEQFVV